MFSHAPTFKLRRKSCTEEVLAMQLEPFGRWSIRQILTIAAGGVVQRCAVAAAWQNKVILPPDPPFPLQPSPKVTEVLTQHQDTL